MLSAIQSLGGRTIDSLRNLGVLSIFIAKTILGFTKRPYYFGLILRQFIVIGYYSLPVVAMTAFFSGAVLALQSYTGFSRFSTESSIATVVVRTFDHKRVRSCSCRFNGSWSCWRFNCSRNWYNASN